MRHRCQKVEVAGRWGGGGDTTVLEGAAHACDSPRGFEVLKPPRAPQIHRLLCGHLFEDACKRT